MTSPSYRRIAVIDIGKTNAKVVVIDAATGEECASRRSPNRSFAGPPYLHYDVGGLWAFIMEALAELGRAPGYEAISVTTHGASFALLDGAGELALPVIDYEAIYPEDIRKAYDALRPSFSETMSPGLPAGLNAGAQIHFQQSAFPGAFARVKTILAYPQYWVFRLTGVVSNEKTSLGCHTDLWAIRKDDYSSLVDTLGIRDLMAPIASAFDRMGWTTPSVTSALGLTEPVPVYCGIHDSNASLLPHLVGRQAPFTVVSTGTWVISFAVGGDLDGLDADRDMLANLDAYGRPVPSSRFMGGREYEILTSGLGPASDTEIAAGAASLTARGVMLLPSVSEGSGPFPTRRMEWAGAPATDAERHAAIALYLALMTASSLKLLGAAGPTVVEGPFRQNRLYLRALAAITGRAVIIVEGGAPTGTAEGAALLAGMPLPEAHDQVVEPWPDLEPYIAKWAGLAGIALR
jgi:sugar (pentulose or hexulose) kinase